MFDQTPRCSCLTESTRKIHPMKWALIVLVPSVNWGARQSAGSEDRDAEEAVGSRESGDGDVRAADEGCWTCGPSRGWASASV